MVPYSTLCIVFYLTVNLKNIFRKLTLLSMIYIDTNRMLACRVAKMLSIREELASLKFYLNLYIFNPSNSSANKGLIPFRPQCKVLS